MDTPLYQNFYQTTENLLLIISKVLYLIQFIYEKIFTSLKVLRC